jgi:subtilisin family serine protease
MKNSKLIHALLILLIPFVSSCPLAADGAGGRPLSGTFVGKSHPERVIPDLKEGEATGLEGRALSFADLPVVSEGLRAVIAKMKFSDSVRVVVWLKYQPQDLIGKQVREQYAEELMSIQQRIRAINSRYACQRKLDAPGDSANYFDPVLAMSPEDREALRAVGVEHEALSLVVSNEIADRLREEVEADQASVRRALERLGAAVEYGAISVNALVARLPVMAVDRAAGMDKVARICEDLRYDRCLTNIDNATRTSDPGGLWDNGQTGGIYDPAVLDSGINLLHPALVDDAGRTNFYSWYLVAAYDDPDWDDVTSEDDRHGHGTHVMGIVASHGDDSYPQWLGLAPGAEKVVTL